MLKIKNNVDLKELEKFGFDSDENDYFYDFIPYKYNNGQYILIRKDTKDLYFDYFDIEYIDEAINILYDLIKADLVEKVE